MTVFSPTFGEAAHCANDWFVTKRPKYAAWARSVRSRRARQTGSISAARVTDTGKTGLQAYRRMQVKAPRTACADLGRLAALIMLIVSMLPGVKGRLEDKGHTLR